jgi:dTDP-4-dehydrorhamnose reductase
MLGNAVLRLFSRDSTHETYGTSRAATGMPRLIGGIDAGDDHSLRAAFEAAQPELVINCIGLVKQLADANDPLIVVPINTLLPHRLAALCADAGARLVHISTDCVFSGSRGNYREEDFADAKDLYGRSKLLGEVDYPHAVTLRTSIIGHELSSQHGLIGWFLAQEGTVKGFRKAVFSGLPTMELARVIRDFVIPQPELHGVYHVASAPIDKFSLLKLVAETYRKQIEIIPDDTLVIDRSLDSARFMAATGYQPGPWPELVRLMHDSK